MLCCLHLFSSYHSRGEGVQWMQSSCIGVVNHWTISCQEVWPGSARHIAKYGTLQQSARMTLPSPCLGLLSAPLKSFTLIPQAQHKAEHATAAGNTQSTDHCWMASSGHCLQRDNIALMQLHLPKLGMQGKLLYTKAITPTFSRYRVSDLCSQQCQQNLAWWQGLVSSPVSLQA